MKKVIFVLIVLALVLVFVYNIFYSSQDLSLFIQTSHAQPPKIELITYAGGFNLPIDIQNMGDDRLFIIQQRGLIKIIDSAANVLPTPFLDISNKVSQSGWETGLLGLAFHPDYKNNGYFYVNYTRNSDDATVISRFSVDATNPDLADPSSETILITVSQPYNNHNGGDLRFGPDAYLYIALGDGGSGGDPQNYAQNRNSFLGKILRIDVDNGNPYGIPDDNPFVGDTTTLDEIWALGLRNHWRNSFDRFTGDLWIADVGQSKLEEVNLQPANSKGGENYGWRCYEGTESYNLSGCGPATNYVFPVFEYAHYGVGCSGSLTGGHVYRGAIYNNLFGKYIMADFCKGDLYWVQQTDTGFISGHLGQFTSSQYSSFGEDRYGELYISLLSSGNIQKVTDTSDCKPVSVIKEGALKTFHEGSSAILNAFYHPSLEYQWFRNGILLENEVSYQLQTDQEGNYTVEVTNPANSCVNSSNVIEVVEVPVGTNNPSGYIPELLLYPNPAENYIKITGFPLGKNIKVNLYNSNGKLINVVTENDTENVLVNSDKLSAGLYFVKIQVEGLDVINRRVVIR